LLLRYLGQVFPRVVWGAGDFGPGGGGKLKGGGEGDEIT
jgi:hypothetical protein